MAYPAPAGYAASPGLAGHPVNYAVPSIDLVGAGQIGAAMSAVFNLIPCLLLAWFGTAFVSGVRWVLDALAGASLRLPIPIATVDVPINYIELFRLRSFYNLMIYWDDRAWMTFALLFLVPWVLSIVSGALYGGLLAAIYNAVGKASGGMRVTLVSSQGPSYGQPGPPATWSPGPPGVPAAPGGAWPNQGWPNEPRR